MIRLSDALILAGTKLRTRKTRTIVTAILASLLFAALVFAFTMVKGGIASYARYSSNGLSGRYITNVYYYGWVDIDLSSSKLIVKAKERNKQVIANKQSDAKRLGIPYDPAGEPPVTTTDGMGGSAEYLNMQNLAVQQIMKQLYAQQKTNVERATEDAAVYRPKNIFAARSFGDTSNLTIMKAGKESFGSVGQQAQTTIYGQDPLTTLSYMPRTISDSFLLDGANLTKAITLQDEIPVIVTFADAEKALGLKSLPKTATNTEQLQRVEEVKRRAVNETLTVCYRNAASKQAIEQTQQQINEIKAHKNDKNYQMPSQIYALPASTSCGPVVVTKDTRSALEKQFVEKQREFNVKYGLETTPVQKKLTFRIVGLSANLPDYANMSTLDSLAMIIGGTSLMGQWVIPSELVDESIQKKFIPQTSPGDSTSTWYANSSVGTLVEFSSASDAKQFQADKGCMTNCTTQPSITYFGSNSVLIDSITANATHVLQIAGLVVSAVAAILMMGMVGRVITDSRRETAVFRAIGAKRNDIRLIYTLYVVTFSLIIAGLALAIGFSGALLYSNSVSESLTASARLMFIESNETSPFVLVDLWPEAVGLTTAMIVLAGFAAMLLPLARNLARSPLKDMRDE